MANCHNLFTDYNSRITLADSKCKGLRKSRKILRDRIRKYFKENKQDEIYPRFTSQGSFVHGTTVEPIPEKKVINENEYMFIEYDVDDGIYFIGNSVNRKTPATYHNWIMKAVEGQTSTFDPEDKTTCVRVLYSDGHHIDLPIYFKEEGKVPQLAHKTKGWIDSDPKEFSDWLKKYTDENPQIAKLIKYFKGWKGYRENRRKDKSFPSGFILSILVCENYVKNERDDISFKETLSRVYNALQYSYSCYRPTTPTGEDLFDSYAHKDYFLKQLKDTVEKGTDAIKEANHKKACEIWQSVFGPRFSCANAKDEEQNTGASAAFISTASKSRPWAD